MADATQLRQVFLNIILNSCEAMNNNGRLIIITAFSKKEKVVKVQIIDNGIGIAEKDLSKIFDPFFTSKEQGTGLGLSVVYGIISSHHGTVQVKSKVGEGTTIVIKLPMEVMVSAANHPSGEGMKSKETSKKQVSHKGTSERAQ
jgi:two-component system NtrC family sensor kinase